MHRSVRIVLSVLVIASAGLLVYQRAPLRVWLVGLAVAGGGAAIVLIACGISWLFLRRRDAVTPPKPQPVVLGAMFAGSVINLVVTMLHPARVIALSVHGTVCVGYCSIFGALLAQSIRYQRAQRTGAIAR